jgi:hypothetical protein
VGPQQVDRRRRRRADRHRRQRGAVCPGHRAQTDHLTVFQRTPIWISPRHDIPCTPEYELFQRDPAEAQKLRDAAFDAYESWSFDVEAQQMHETTEPEHSYLMRMGRIPRCAPS